jgi:DNA topoisomerase-1
MKTLILVESPTKARTIARYAREVLEGPVVCRACLGHLRDLPDERLGVDIAQGFAPEYILRNLAILRTLRPLVQQAGRVILATDPDREGEAVAWDILKVFENELRHKTVWRVTFNALTREVIQGGLRAPRELNKNLVRAAVARRVTDRLIGYHISPRLWAALPGKDHGVGRVQAATLQMLCSHSDLWEVHVDL